MNNTDTHWTLCLKCQGRGKKSKGISKKLKLRYQRALEHFKQKNCEGLAPIAPSGHLETCSICGGSGLVNSEPQQSLCENSNNNDYPHIAIIGAGIGGAALAVACLHRQIPFTLYERDSGFNVRSQGYGLTLQQASRAIDALGITALDEGVVSTRHAVHTIEGKVIGEWGIRKWLPTETDKPIAKDSTTAPKRTNIHIARQSLRAALLAQLEGHATVHWNHQLLDFNACENGGVNLSFQVNGMTKIQHAKADIVVGADGIRSSVRQLLIGEDTTPLRYLDCIVILGICPLADIQKPSAGQPENALHNSLLDSATVFQTANGHERIYMMPFNSKSIMWQLSFPMPEQEAKALSAQGKSALKHEALRRCQWHYPIPEILAATPETHISGYPVYDRAPLVPEYLAKAGPVTLLGDAAHPMSPFKGQGANQALLDALALAREITKSCRPQSQWREIGARKTALTHFETEMLQRSASKVKDSADAAQFLHSDIALYEGNEPRGRCLKNDGD